MELTTQQHAVVSAMVNDLNSDPALVAQIQSFAQMQSNPYDFGSAVLKAMRVDGMSTFPRVKKILDKDPGFPAFALGDIDIDWGDLLGAAVTAGAGYFTAKMGMKHGEDMAKLQLDFEKDMFNRTQEENALARKANEELAKQIKEAKEAADRRALQSGYTGGGGGEGGDDDGLPSWVLPVGIGVGGLLVVGAIILKKK